MVELEDITLNAGTFKYGAARERDTHKMSLDYKSLISLHEGCFMFPNSSSQSPHGVRLYISPIGALARVDIILVPLLLLPLV